MHSTWNTLFLARSKVWIYGKLSAIPIILTIPLFWRRRSSRTSNCTKLKTVMSSMFFLGKALFIDSETRLDYSFLRNNKSSFGNLSLMLLSDKFNIDSFDLKAAGNIIEMGLFDKFTSSSLGYPWNPSTHFILLFSKLSSLSSSIGSVPSYGDTSVIKLDFNDNFSSFLNDLIPSIFSNLLFSSVKLFKLLNLLTPSILVRLLKLIVSSLRFCRKSIFWILVRWFNVSVRRLRVGATFFRWALSLSILVISISSISTDIIFEYSCDFWLCKMWIYSISLSSR